MRLHCVTIIWSYKGELGNPSSLKPSCAFRITRVQCLHELIVIEFTLEKKSYICIQLCTKMRNSFILLVKKILITSLLPIVIKQGQMGFSKASDSISDHLTPDPKGPKGLQLEVRPLRLLVFLNKLLCGVKKKSHATDIKHNVYTECFSPPHICRFICFQE